MKEQEYKQDENQKEFKELDIEELEQVAGGSALDPREVWVD